MRFFLEFCFIFFLALSVQGQHISDVKYFDLEDGLQEEGVLKVVRDGYGFFYLATSNHLQQFDGQNFVDIDLGQIKKDRLGIDELKQLKTIGNSIYLIFKGRQKFLYRIKAGATDIIKEQFNPHASSYIIDNTYIYAISSEQKDLISVYDAKYRFLFNFNLEDSDDASIENIVHKNDLIFIEWENGRHSVYNKNDQIWSHPDIQGKLFKSSLDEIFLFSKDKVYTWDGKGFAELFSGLNPIYSCTFIKEDKLGNILAGCTSTIRHIETYYLIDKGREELKEFNTLLDVSPFVADVYSDNFHADLLLATYKGLYSVKMEEKVFRTLLKMDNIAKGQFGNIITGLAVDRNGQVHAAKESYEYFVIDSLERISTPVKAYYDRGYFYNNQTLSIDVSENSIYTCTYFSDQDRSHLYKYQVDEDSVQIFRIPFKVFDVVPSNDTSVYLAGGYLDKSGVFGNYNLRTKVFTPLVQREDLMNKNIRALLFDKTKQCFLLGTERGLVVVDKNFSQIKLLNRNAVSDSHFLDYDHIRTINKFGNKILLGTLGGGLFILDDSYDIIKRIDMSNGLSNDNVISIIQDDQANYWVGTFNGLNVLDSAFNLIKNFYLEDGLSDKEFNTRAVTKDNNGHLYFGSLNGITKINPQRALQMKDSKGVFIDEFIAKTDSKSEIINGQDTNFNLQGYKNSIELYFKFPNYRKEMFGNPLYSLDIDTDSSIKKNIFDDRIELSNLPADAFSVKISSNDYLDFRELKIDNSRDYSPFINYILFALAILGLSFLVSRYFIERNRRKEQEKTKLNRRISEMQLSSLQSQMNPHFIFNALGAIQYFIQTNETDKADEYLSDFAKLIRSILESSKSRYISLREELDMLKIYVGLEQVRFEDRFDYKFIIDDNIDLESMIPPMMIQPFIENAINHGIVNLKDKKGLLSIHFEKINAKKIRCHVIDNGIGREASAHTRLKKHKSRGMEIVNERISTINSSNILKIDLQILDRYDGNRPAGTEVVLDLEEVQ